MKKRVVLLTIMAFVTLISVGLTVLCDQDKIKQEEDTLTVVTSFYPMYIIAENIVDGVNNVNLVNLTENHGGCLHDYQLTTTDMRKLEHADIFIMNGGGMEGFIEEILSSYPDITIIDASEDIELLDVSKEEASHHDAHHNEEHDHEGEHKNAHVWMNPQKYKIQVETITKGLMETDSEHKEEYQKNCDSYTKKVEVLDEELKTLNTSKLQNGIISFHDAFAYLADALSIPVIHSVDLDKDTSLSAGEVAEIIDEVRENNVTYIFTEEQLSKSSPKRVAKESGATLCIVDSLVSGDTSKDSYLSGMEKNIEMLKQVLEDE